MTDAEVDRKPDALIVGTRASDLPGLAGAPASLIESVRLARFDEIVILTIPAVGPLDGDVRMAICADNEEADVLFAHEREALRRDGFELREGDPWEIGSPLDSEEVPF